MFSTKVRGGKAFAFEQKIREFKKILLKSQKTEEGAIHKGRWHQGGRGDQPNADSCGQGGRGIGEMKMFAFSKILQVHF